MFRHQRTILALVLLSIFVAFSPASAQDERCFGETSQCVNGRFLQYWQQNGGLAVFGYPITGARQEPNRDTGQSYLTQWFERNRFEQHPENAAPYDVLLGRLGDDRLVQLGRDWRTEARDSGPRDGCLWFAQTSLNVCNQEGALGFRQYWESHGLADPRLDAYSRSLALFGLPLTQPRTETNSSGDTVLTQWFERARFEWHPNNPAEFKVLLGRLGDEVHQEADSVKFPGGRIVYTSGENGYGDIYTMNPDGSAQRRITTTNAVAMKRAELAVSPTGNRLVYRQGANLYVVNIDGTDQSIIASADPGLAEQPELFSPVWAPDASYVAFVLNNDVYASKADGSALVRITQSGDVITPGCLSWARTGVITFLKSGRATNHIWTVNSDGSNARQVGWGLCPAMTLAGDRIAYRNGGDIQIMNADGDVVWSLTSGRNFVRPLWSPDGRRILAAEAGGINDLFVFDAQSGAARQLTDDPAFDALPAWSPDGTAITFASNRSGRDGVYIMLADGSGERLLPTPLESTAPQWSN